MISEKKQEQIRQLFEEGYNKSEIARKVNVDRKTVNLCLDKQHTTQEKSDRKDIKKNTEPPQIQKDAVTVQPPYSKEVLEKAKEFIEKEKKEEIIDDYWRNILHPLIDEGELFTKEGHEDKIKELKKSHNSEISELKTSYDSEISQVKREKQDLGNKIRKLCGDNEALWETKGSLSDYIGNYLDDAGRRETRRLEQVRESLATEKTNFNIDKEKENKTLKKLALDNYNELKKIEKQKEAVEKKEKEIEKRKEQLAELRREIGLKVVELEKKEEHITLERNLLEKDKENFKADVAKKKDELCGKYVREQCQKIREEYNGIIVDLKGEIVDLKRKLI